MRPRIAIPVPHSGDSEYAGRALPQYLRAVELAGGEAVVIPLDSAPSKIEGLAVGCDGVLLPGSRADVLPEKYGAARIPSQPRRTCRGMRSMNCCSRTLMRSASQFLGSATACRF